MAKRMDFNLNLPSSRRRWVLYLALVLTLGLVVIWPTFASPLVSEALEATLDAVARAGAWGFTLGKHHFTLGQLAVGGVVLYAAVLFSRAVRGVLRRGLAARGHVDEGIQATIGTLVHYGVVCVGAYAAFSAAGFDLSSFALVASALGIGIGFGLQNLVQNFASGLILLFERPVRVGDIVQVDGQFAEVRRIGLRSTVVETVEGAEVIMPNNLLVAEKVINWTLSSRRARLTMPVGVTFDSPVDVVLRELIEAGESLEGRLDTPPPNAVFLRMGASALEFEVRVWLADAAELPAARSQLVTAVLRRFAEAGIEIPRPQHDIWVHGPAVMLSAPKPPTSD